MKTIFFSGFILSFLSGCFPESKLYYTPPVYYPKTITAPVLDSGVKFSVAGTISTAIRGNVSATMYFGKYFYGSAGFGFNRRGFGENKKTESIKDPGFDYKNHYKAAEFEVGFKKRFGISKSGWFTSTGYGRGNSHSVIYDAHDLLYHYSGNFSKIFAQSGFLFSPNKKNKKKNYTRMVMAARYSSVVFSDHFSPEGNFHNQEQSLFDCSFQISHGWKKINLNGTLGRHLNGTVWGYRNIDGKLNDWRIEPWYLSFGMDIHFYKSKR